MYIYFIYLWLRWVFIVVHGLSLVAASEGYSPAAVCRLLLAVASLAMVHSLQGIQASGGAARDLSSCGS